MWCPVMGIELKPSRKGSQSLWVSCLLANTQVQDPAGVTGGGDTTLGLHPKSGRFSAKRCSCFRRCLRFIFLLESDLTSMYGLSSDFLKKQVPSMGKTPWVSFTVTGDLISAVSRGEDTICLFTRKMPTLGQAIPTLHYSDYTGPRGK